MGNMDLIKKIETRNAIVGVIGLGYVGLPLVLGFGRAGFRVIGFDIDDGKVERLNRGESYIRHIHGEDIGRLIKDQRFLASSDFSKLSEVDCICVCVPTPLTEKKEPDLTFVKETTKQIAKYLRKGQLVVLESTTYPGTTDELVAPILTSNGLALGKDFHLAFSPEREDPGNSHFSLQTIPKVVGGVTPQCAEVARALYQSVTNKVIMVSSSRAAELTKLLENIYRCVNIALVNELKMLADRMGIDIWEVIEAASTKPFGFTPFYPGPGLGGHCIPIDPFYLSWKAKEHDFATKFIELSGEINTSMPYYVVQKTIETLNQKKECLNGSCILILGVSYKRDIDDIRESPAIKIIELLQERGAKVLYNDPYIPKFPPMRKSALSMSSVDLDETVLSQADCVMIITDHGAYDYQWIVDNARLVVDTRNATKNVKRGREKIIKV
jgi:UDP-N-acetyl-D-glucosamine dehydrogenase